MAALRLLYRKRKLLLMLLFMSLFWVVFLYLSTPPAEGFRKKAVERDKISPTRITVTQIVLKKDSSNHNRRQGVQDSDKPSVDRMSGPQHNLAHIAPLLPPNSVEGSINISSIIRGVINRTTSNHSKEAEKDKPPAEIGHVDQMLKLGAQMKNKTLQKLSDFGIIAKPKKSIIKQIDRHSILNITMSDDEFLFVIQTLMKEAEIKSSKLQNRTIPVVTSGNMTNSTAHKKPDLCDCHTSECSCCARLQLTKLHVDRKACANFTFVPKHQEMSFNFLLDGKVHFTETVSAEHPPKICLGSTLKAVGICVDFYDMSFKVNIHEEHKTQLSGCLTFGFNVYNKTISTFPLGCFQIPSSHHRDQGQHQIPLLGNWVP